MFLMIELILKKIKQSLQFSTVMLSMQNKTSMKKKPKPDEVLASASHTEDIYMHKVNKNWEYKQRKFPNSSDIHNQDVNKFSDVLIYSRAGFVLPLAICKTLNDQMDRFSTFSNPTFPLTSHIPAQFPMFTPRPLSCSVTKYKRTHN